MFPRGQAARANTYVDQGNEINYNVRVLTVAVGTGVVVSRPPYKRGPAVGRRQDLGRQLRLHHLSLLRRKRATCHDARLARCGSGHLGCAGPGRLGLRPDGWLFASRKQTAWGTQYLAPAIIERGLRRSFTEFAAWVVADNPPPPAAGFRWLIGEVDVVNR